MNPSEKVWSVERERRVREVIRLLRGWQLSRAEWALICEVVVPTLPRRRNSGRRA